MNVKMPTSLLRGALPICIALAGPAAVLADAEFVIPSTAEAARVNENTIGVVFTHEELYHQLVHNLEDELEHDSGLRIVPTMGKNHVQSVYDLLYLKGIDLALVRADALEFVRREGDMPSVGRITNSIAKLSEEKIVVLASEDYASLEELDGQVIGFGLPGSGEYVTGTVALDTLGIDVVPLEVDSTLGIERVQSGELAAMVYLLRPADAVQTGDDLAASEAIAALEESDGVHVLPLPENEALAQIYRPTTLTEEDLPGLIAEGESLPSYSVDVVLAAYNWPADHPRLARQQRFVDALVGGLDGLQGDAYEPAWKRVDLSERTPNVAVSPLVAEALAEREQGRREALAAAELVKERAAAEVRAERLAELERRRDALTARLGKELDEADAAELEQLLGQLDTLFEQVSEGEPSGAVDDGEAGASVAESDETANDPADSAAEDVAD